MLPSHQNYMGAFLFRVIPLQSERLIVTSITWYIYIINGCDEKNEKNLTILHKNQCNPAIMPIVLKKERSYVILLSVIHKWKKNIIKAYVSYI